jgi:hypothetical protein
MAPDGRVQYAHQPLTSLLDRDEVDGVAQLAQDIAAAQATAREAEV